MMPSVWALLRANPSALIGLVAITVIAMGTSFGGGYYVAVKQFERSAASAVIDAAANQEKHDLAQHKAAVVEDQKAEERHATGDAATDALIARVPEVVTNACILSPETIDLLNQAGRQ